MEAKTSVHDHAVIVLGGGPAGCASAILLAGEGHDVALVRPEAPPASSLAQSIPPSADKILVELGLLSALERAGVHRNGGNTAWWAGEDATIEVFQEGRKGFHLDRGRLEDVMASVARGVGVRVFDLPAREAIEDGDGWRVRCPCAEGPSLELRAPWVVDATGRRGLIASREGRRVDRRTTTFAIVRRWKREGGFPESDPTHTLIQSYEDGWAWSVPLDHEVRCFTAMVDHRYSSLSEATLDETLEAELAKAPRVAAGRGGATPIGPAWACPALLYSATRFGRSGLVLVGDAGSFIDPISSFGVKKALSSGWLGGIAVHTALADSAMEETALRFFQEREGEVYRTYRAASADFFEACAQAYGHPYWIARAEAAREAGGDAPGRPEPDAFGEEGVSKDVARTALARIQARPNLDAVRGSSVRTVERPTVVGHRIVLAEHLASDHAPRGLRWVRNVDLARLVDLAPGYADAPDGWVAYNAGAPAVALPDYLAALATAFAAGLLEHGEP